MSNPCGKNLAAEKTTSALHESKHFLYNFINFLVSLKRNWICIFFGVKWNIYGMQKPKQKYFARY